MLSVHDYNEVMVLMKLYYVNNWFMIIIKGLLLTKTIYVKFNKDKYTIR